MSSPSLRLCRSVLADEAAVTAMEYGLIAAGIGAAIVGSVLALGGDLGQLWGSTATALNGAAANLGTN